MLLPSLKALHHCLLPGSKPLIYLSPESSKGHSTAGEALKQVTQEPDPVTLLAGVALRKQTNQSDRGIMPN